MRRAGATPPPLLPCAQLMPPAAFSFLKKAHWRGRSHLHACASPLSERAWQPATKATCMSTESPRNHSVFACTLAITGSSAREGTTPSKNHWLRARPGHEYLAAYWSNALRSRGQSDELDGDGRHTPEARAMMPRRAAAAALGRRPPPPTRTPTAIFFAISLP